jgi:CXCXC repeat
MSPWKMLDRIVNDANCTWFKDDWAITVDAPNGKVFDSNNCHCVCAEFDDGFGGTGSERMKEIWAAVKAIEKDIRYGFSDCEDDNCEWCEVPR